MEWQREIPVSTTVGEAYRLLRLIGRGAHGSVHEAQEQRLGRRCVIKIMDMAASSDEALARFHSQAELATRLHHPHLVTVHDFGTAPGGEPFLVMEYLEGEDLARRQRRVGRFAPPVIAHVVKQIASALAALHAEGLAHLALKPTNVFLVPGSYEDEPDYVKVLDFGTSQVENALVLSHPSMLEDSLPYVSPEQAGGSHEPLDGAADQWALACMAWEMLTGRSPFGGQDPTALLYQIVYEDPLPITDLTLQLPPGLMQVLLRALDKRREHRFGNVLEFAQAFEEVAGPLVLAPRPQPQRVQPPLVASASGPVFLPGLHHREAEAPRRASGLPSRGQGVRVPSMAAPPPVAASPTPPSGPGHDLTVPPTVDHTRPVATLPPQLTPRPRRRWLLVGALPVAASIALFARWSGSRRRATRAGGEEAVDLERPVSPPAAPAPPESPAAGPDIVQLAPPAPVVSASKEAAGRGKGRRARRAALRAKARARRVKARPR